MKEKMVVGENFVGKEDFEIKWNRISKCEVYNYIQALESMKFKDDEYLQYNVCHCKKIPDLWYTVMPCKQHFSAKDLYSNAAKVVYHATLLHWM